MDESEITQNIVSLTADTMELAEHVLVERRKRDGQEFSSEKPSPMEIMAVSNLIVNMSVAGMYKEKKPDDWVPPSGMIDAFLKRVEPIIDFKVQNAISRAKDVAWEDRPQSVEPLETPRPPPTALPEDEDAH